MKFLIDESADARLAAYLRARGYDVTLVAQDYQPGLPDEAVLAIAQSEQLVLITDDRDFGELVFGHRRPHAGVIYLRLDTSILAIRTERLEYVLTHYADQLDQFLVVTRQRVRVRTRGTGEQDTIL
jgi:predicted nuclease of predicted toxin-antitoxin system